MGLQEFLLETLLAGCILLTHQGKGSTNTGGFCKQFNFDLFRDTVKNRVLKRHTFQTFTVQNAPECQLKCISDCRCLSTNYREISNHDHGHCELNNADHILEPKQLAESPGSYFYKLKRNFVCQKDPAVVFEPRHHACPISCCRSSVCPAHTTCREMCLPKFKRFICECPPGNTTACEQLPRSCADISRSLGFSPADGLYHVYGSQDSLYQVYCDFNSESGFAFTLIESFAFINRNIFNTLGFHADASLEQDSFNWKKYRLSKKRMQDIAMYSTHLRATCNKHNAFRYADYFRVKLQELNIFEIFKAKCPRYERINFADQECFNCTVGTWQVANEHFHISSYYSVSLAGCEFGYTGFSRRMFGFYPSSKKTESFSCCSSDESTTQFWIGSKSSN